MFYIKAKITALILVLGIATFAGANEYDLSAYLTRVEQENLNLKLVRCDLEKATQNIVRARSAMLPSIAVQGGYARNFNDIKQSTAVGADLNSTTNGTAPFIYQDIDSNYDNEYLMSLSFNQKIFAPETFANYGKAKKGQEISVVTYEAVHRSVLTTAKKLYVRTHLMTQVVDVMEAAERTAKENYRNAERRFKAGLSTELDLLMAENTWKASIPATAETRRNSKIALISFKNLAGIPLGEDVVLTEPDDEIPPLPGEYTLEEVLAGRPDYAASVLSKEISDISRKAALASFLPSVNGSLTYARGLYRGYDSSNDSYDYSSFQLGLTVTVPIYTGGYRFSLLKAAEIAQNEASITIKKKRNDIEQDLLRLRLILEETYKRIDSARAAENVARRVLALAQVSYSNGLCTQSASDDALNKYQQARLGLYNALYEYRTAYYDWELATGKDN